MLLLWGKSLIGWAAETAAATELFDHVILSTDSKSYADEGRRYGCSVLYLRSAQLASDQAPIAEVLMELLRHTSGSQDWETITLLEPTCPLRTPEIVISCAKICVNNLDVHSSLTLTDVPLHYHAIKQFNLNEEGQVSYSHSEGSNVTNRQNLKTTYIRNGAAYTFRVDSFREAAKVVHGNTRGLVLTQPMVNIDTISDVNLLRTIESQNAIPNWCKLQNLT